MSGVRENGICGNFLRVFSHLFYILFENESSSLKNVQKPFFIFLSTFLIYTFDHIFKVTFLRFKIQRNYCCIRANLKGGRNNIIRVFENLRNNFQTVFVRISDIKMVFMIIQS